MFMMKQNFASKVSLSENDLPVERKSADPNPFNRWSICLEFDISADARRLFHALTAPEYLETWLTFPGQHFGCSTVVTRIEDDYQIKHECEGKPAICISGEYRSCQRHNLAFLWRVEGTSGLAKTRVDIRLRGNFGSTTLLLRHNGFDDAALHAWHLQMWSASMAKLIRLFDSSGYRSESVLPRPGHRSALAESKA
jgi:uncharacterized protein YndB with AHSA1/START domain